MSFYISSSKNTNTPYPSGSVRDDSYFANVDLAEAFKKSNIQPQLKTLSLSSLMRQSKQDSAGDAFSVSETNNRSEQIAKGSIVDKNISDTISEPDMLGEHEKRLALTLAPQKSSIPPETMELQQKITLNALVNMQAMQNKDTAQEAARIEQNKIQSKAAVIRVVTSALTTAVASWAAIHVPVLAPLFYGASRLVNGVVDWGAGILLKKPGFHKAYDTVASGLQMAKSLFVSIFKNPSVKFAGSSPTPNQPSGNSSQGNGLKNAVSNFLANIQDAIQKTAQASRQNQPQIILLAQKELMQSTKKLIDEVGDEAAKKKAYKAEQVYKNYERYIDLLDDTNSELTFADFPATTRQYLQAALYHALSSQEETLISWARDYAKKISINDEVIENIITSTK